MSTPPAKLRWPARHRSGNGSASCSLRIFNAANFIITFALFIATGCGAPGEPVPPSPPVAAPIADLAAHQAGDGVQLTFTMPTRSVTGDRLTATPAIEILRGSAKPDGSPDLKTLHVVENIPGALAEKYFSNDKFQFTDPVSPVEIRSMEIKSIRSPFVYAVRTRLSQKRASPNSNVISLNLYSVPEPIAAVQIQITEQALELTWAPVNRAFSGDTLGGTPDHYNVYRAELDETTGEAAKGGDAQLSSNLKLQLLSSQPENKYSDKSFEFGKTYTYIVRSVITSTGKQLESSDSAPTIVTPRDTFPPATPQSIVAAVLHGETAGALLVDLSWSINVESDFAGYRVYRSELQPPSDNQAAKGQLLTPELLPTPAYRDTSVQPAHRYWYSVTAVDRAGNESAPGPPVAVEVVENSQP